MFFTWIKPVNLDVASFSSLHRNICFGNILRWSAGSAGIDSWASFMGINESFIVLTAHALIDSSRNAFIQAMDGKTQCNRCEPPAVGWRICLYKRQREITVSPHKPHDQDWIQIKMQKPESHHMRPYVWSHWFTHLFIHH